VLARLDAPGAGTPGLLGLINTDWPHRTLRQRLVPIASLPTRRCARLHQSTVHFASTFRPAFELARGQLVRNRLV
jgi:hypothetical protein